MNRREFLRLMGWGLAAGWAAGRLAWPLTALAGNDRGVRLALLADAHLLDGDDRRPAARSLARAVAEIRGLSPAPDLVLFAGDLADGANPQALALGREILSDLPAPLLAVMGEGDGLPDESGPWRHLFGEPRFSHSFPFNPPSPQPSPPWGEREKLWRFSRQSLSILLPKTENRKPKTVIQVLGLHTSWCPGPAGPGFYVGEAGRRWLARELTRLDPNAPLVVLSHAPLARVFRPWQQWTADAPQVAQLLAPFRQVLCFHGHVHRPEASGGWLGDVAGYVRPGEDKPIRSAPWQVIPPNPPLEKGGIQTSYSLGRTAEIPPFLNENLGGFPWSPLAGILTENRKPKTENHLWNQGLPATAWPRPLAPMGTPAALRPGLGPRGCGWAQLSLGPASRQFQPRLWQA